MIIKHLSRRQFSALAGRLFAGLAAFSSFGGCSVPSSGNKSFSDLAAKIAGEVITRDHENYADRRPELELGFLGRGRLQQRRRARCGHGAG